jgi:5-methylcytosine-specific restriction endonuclease McrA
MKTCSSCETLKPVDDFHRNRSCPDGRAYSCKACVRPKLKANTARWKENNRPAALAQRARYRVKNKDQVNLYDAIRQAKQRADRIGAPSIPYTANDLIAMWGPRDEWKCVYCGTGENMSLDHYVPLANGGTDAWYNIVPACTSCNSKKGCKPVIQFLKGQPVPSVYGPGLAAEAFNALRKIVKEYQDCPGA